MLMFVAKGVVFVFVRGLKGLAISSGNFMQAGARSISKGGLAESLSSATEVKKSDCMKVLTHLADIVSKEVKKTGKVGRCV